MARSNRSSEEKRREKEQRRAEAQRQAYAFMQGRNGTDELSTAAMWAALLVAVVDFFAHTGVLALVALALMAWSVYRSFSRNIAARARERQVFLNVTRMPRQAIKLARLSAQNREKRYFLCKQCGTILSVPRGKGKIRVTCPHCHTKAVKKS